MPYIPNTTDDQQAMLEAIGVGSLDELFAMIPAELRMAGELDLPVILPTRPMMNYRFPTLAIDDIAALANRHPQTRFILSGPNYLAEFRAAIEAMHRCPNMVIETSCMQGFQAIRRMVDAVGADRVLFGTGAVLHYPACNVAKLDHADLTDEQRTAVAAETAQRILRLPP